MEQSFQIAVAASLVAGAITTGGILTVRSYETWARRNSTYFACFAAGVLIAVSFLHIAPKSFSMHEQAPAYLFAGYPLMRLFNRFITAYVCDKPQTAEYALGLVPLLGIGFHSFVDGVIYSIGFSVSVFTGLLVALGMVLHEFPKGIVTTRFSCVAASRSDSRSSSLFSRRQRPPGSERWFLIRSSAGSTNRCWARCWLSAGALIYVGATHLLPRAETEPRRFSLIALAAGIVAALGIVLTKG